MPLSWYTKYSASDSWGQPESEAQVDLEAGPVFTASEEIGGEGYGGDQEVCNNRVQAECLNDVYYDIDGVSPMLFTVGTVS